MKLFAFLFILLSVTFSNGFSQEISVVTYNIRFNNPGDGINAWPNRKEKVTTLLLAQDFDFIGIQEALYDQILDLDLALNNYQRVGGGRDDGKNKGEFTAIYYNKNRWTLKYDYINWLSDNFKTPGSIGWDAALPRIFVGGTFESVENKKSIVVTCTHFDHVGVQARENSANIIMAYLNGINANRNFAHVLVGDFNAPIGDKPYQIFTEKAKNVKLYFKDCRPANNTNGTYCGFEVGKQVCTPIDHIFVSNHWEILDFNIVDANDGKYYPSDHKPVYARIKLR
ncbi:MAG: endonuclease/exonuclease/phosphatase family protein [Chryseotalea sp.]